jgi:phosphodiesterase/alkaline phosphatase D-like protein
VKFADRRFDADALARLGRGLAETATDDWPDAMLMLGDQVYADETSAATQRRIRARRDITRGARDQVADFEEYTWLYLESWTDPDVRWLLSCVPSYMIFDDHDVRDDWNTSQAWRQDVQRTDWWEDRIAGGLASYWVYQHLGNLRPEELRANELYQRVRTSGLDNAALLREFALEADSEADGGKPTRWSFRRDFGRVRLVTVDSRCGRILANDTRSMISDEEFAWVRDQVDGDYDHLLIATSLPWLLARALHDLEAWDEVLCDGVRGARVARFGEWLRRAADLEHWAAFRRSFDRLADMIAEVAARPNGPASICVLSGDVHHAYTAEAWLPDATAPGGRVLNARIYQLTCSPLHNFVPPMMKLTFRIAWSRAAERFTRRLLGTVAPVPRPGGGWRRVTGPFFANELAEFVADGRRASTVLWRSGRSLEEPLREVSRLVLSG